MFSFDAHAQRYPSQRSLVYGRKGMVATTQPLAAQAGIEALRAGGNAIDAAIATAACLAVVEPTGCGIGGDAFALVWTDGKLHGLNSSGQAPHAADPDALRAKGLSKLPVRGWEGVTIPGIPAAWNALAKRFGRLPLAQSMRYAIEYASEGFPVSPTIVRVWEKEFALLKEYAHRSDFEPIFQTFGHEGNAPKAGDICRLPDHARTLEAIAQTDARAFYQGELAERIDAFSKQYGGWLRATDLEHYEPQWVEPIGINYRGYDIWEIPPNGQGIVALMALNILKGFELSHKENIDNYHLQIEAIKLAFADAFACVSDPRHMSCSVPDMLSDAYADERRRMIDMRRAHLPYPGKPQDGGTVYLATADGEGNRVSFTQSNFRGFGSGLVVPGTGIALHNRGCCFSLDKTSPNCLEPDKKPYHTIIPGFITKGGHAVAPFGVMGAYMQPQGHVQVVTGLVDFGLNPQEALDAPRWQWMEGNTVHLEHGLESFIARGLAVRGHDIHIAHDSLSFGRGQIIANLENGAFCGATEMRADGHIAVW